MIGMIEYDINEFHPSLRMSFQAEIDRIQRDTPPFAGKVSIRVVKEIQTECHCENKNCKRNTNDALKSAFAITRSGTDYENNNEIYFNARFFSVDGDIKELHRALKSDKDHGGLSCDPSYILTHEYGHAIDNMISQKWGREEDQCNDEYIPPDGSVAKKYEDLMKEGLDAIPDLQQFLISIGIELPFQYDPDRDTLVSGYAYRNRREFFADTFAAVYHGDDRQRGRETAIMMKGLVQSVYKELFSMEVKQ